MATATSMQASTRRLVYGANVLITSALAIAVAAMVVWAAGRYGGRADLTSSGQNSLSPRTVQLIKSLDTNITITGTYTTALKEVRKYAEKHRNMVRDLLDLYETAGRPRISTAMIDPSAAPADVQKLLKRIVEKPAYKDEATPHREAIAAFPEINKQVAELISTEAASLSAILDANPNLQRSRLQGLLISLSQLQKAAANADVDIKELTESDIPRYGAAVTAMREHLNLINSTLTQWKTWMTGDGQQTPGVTPELRKFFGTAPERYKTVLDRVETQLAKTNDLKKVKFEELYDTLKNGECIVVESEKEAIVVPKHEAWTWRGDRAAPTPDGDPEEFSGEAALSSALLKLTQTKKTAVVFVRHGGQPLLKVDFNSININAMRELPRAPFGMINDAMGKENFVVEEWDVAAAPAPPEIKDAAKTIYVVYPPMPPDMSNPMQQPRNMGITPEQKQAILDAVKKSGLAIFLAGWQPPRSRFGGPPSPYEFGEYLKSTWGIDVKSDYLALKFMPTRDDPKLMYPMILSQQNQFLISSDAFRLTDHAIAKPLQTLPAGLDGSCPLLYGGPTSQPAGVKIEPLIEVPASNDVWAFSNIDRVQSDLTNKQGTRRYDDDIKAPFALALAATNEQGQKLVVFTSDTFFGDGVLNIADFVQVGGALALAAKFPANSDLFLNSLHWLSGESNRISVGPKQGDVPRLDGLKEGPVATFWRAFLVGIWPACAGLVGLGVWFVRRK
ncbi:MAG: Gldg family protein [Planctomycetes bacterium]|nr:Gldg family protein [Planctomycetota bacterium]